MQGNRNNVVWIDLEMDFHVFKHSFWVGMGLGEVADDDANEKIQSLKTSDRQRMPHGKRCLFGRKTAMFLINRKTRGWATLLEKLHYLVIPPDKEHRSKGFWRMSEAWFGGSVVGIHRSSFPFSQARWSSREWQPKLGWCTRRAIAFVHHCRWFLGVIDLYGIEVG